MFVKILYINWEYALFGTTDWFVLCFLKMKKSIINEYNEFITQWFFIKLLYVNDYPIMEDSMLLSQLRSAFCNRAAIHFLLTFLLGFFLRKAAYMAAEAATDGCFVIDKVISIIYIKLACIKGFSRTVTTSRKKIKRIRRVIKIWHLKHF